jgi:glycogen synthase
MKVLMTVDTVGGVWTYALELAAAMPEIEFVLAAQGPTPSAAQTGSAARLRNVALESRECALEWTRECESDLRATGAWLLDLEARHAPDLVHLNDYAHATLGWHAPVLVVAHSCVVSWWQAVHGCPPPREWNAYRQRVAAAFAAADCVVAPSAAFLRGEVALHGNPKRAYVVYNACDPGEREPPGTARRKMRVLAAGRLWDEAKNLRALDDVAAALGAPVLVAGEARAPHGRTAICGAAIPIGALTREELRAHMEESAIYALPALYEPFGLGVLEAALAGCALVLGDIPTLRELWAGAALFVPPRDTAALRRALDELLGDPERRAEMSARARRRALLFSPARMAASYQAVYDQLAGETSPDSAGVAPRDLAAAHLAHRRVRA